MSYDFYISVDTGGDERHYIEPSFSDEHPAIEARVAGNVVVTSQGYARCGNYTSNVSGMWAKCLTAVMNEVPHGREYAGHDAIDWLTRRPDLSDRIKVNLDRLCLRDLNGKKCVDLIPLLRAAVEWGVAHLDELHQDDPENGWGDADGAVTYLWDIQRFCEKHPQGRLEISS